jgi:hypothetical protein
VTVSWSGSYIKNVTVSTPCLTLWPLYTGVVLVSLKPSETPFSQLRKMCFVEKEQTFFFKELCFLTSHAYRHENLIFSGREISVCTNERTEMRLWEQWLTESLKIHGGNCKQLTLLESYYFTWHISCYSKPQSMSMCRLQIFCRYKWTENCFTSVDAVTGPLHISVSGLNTDMIGMK